MKTLIYDNECPLCVAYTGAFVKTGLLEKDGRKNFNEISPDMFSNLDKQKCNDEIPLIDTDTNKVWYGIDALLEILGNKFPLIKKVGNWQPVNWILKRFYKIISYNRKVIVATKLQGYDCSPSFNSFYRILFLLFGLILNSWIFTLAIPLLTETIFTAANYQNLQLVHFSFVAVNIGIAILLGKNRGLEYLGQINMLAILSMLLLLPLILLEQSINKYFIVFLFGMLGCFVSKEYLRRMKYLNIIHQNKTVVFVNMLTILVSIVYLIK